MVITTPVREKDWLKDCLYKDLYEYLDNHVCVTQHWSIWHAQHDIDIVTRFNFETSSAEYEHVVKPDLAWVLHKWGAEAREVLKFKLRGDSLVEYEWRVKCH